MIRADRRVLPRLLLVGGSALCLAAWTAAFVLPRLVGGSPPLDPYLTVVTHLAHEEAGKLLLDAGALQTVTPAGSEVLVSRFNRVETTGLPDALASLDPLDPRRDPWIDRLSSYFTIRGRNVVYASFDLPVARADRLVRRVLGRGSRVAEASPIRNAVATAMFVGLAGITLAAAGSNRVRLTPAVIVWLPAVAAGGLVAAVAAAAMVIAVGWAADEFARVATMRLRGAGASSRALAGRAAALGGTAALSLVYAGRLAGWSAVAPLATALVGSVLAAVLATATFRPTPDPEHRPFEPLAIMSGRPGAIAGRKWARLGLVALPVLLAVPPLADALARGTDVPRPVPRAIAARAFDHEALRAVWQYTGDGGLPDVADYLAHRAHQEGFLYGRGYAFPEADEQIALTRFREQPDGSYSGYREVVMTFDESWSARALADAPAGVASMLVGLGYAAGVVLAPAPAIYSGYSQFLQHLTYVVLVLAPFLLAAVPWARPIRARGSVVELSRRRRQVA